VERIVQSVIWLVFDCFLYTRLHESRVRTVGNLQCVFCRGYIVMFGRGRRSQTPVKCSAETTQGLPAAHAYLEILRDKLGTIVIRCNYDRTITAVGEVYRYLWTDLSNYYGFLAIGMHDLQRVFPVGNNVYCTRTVSNVWWVLIGLWFDVWSSFSASFVHVDGFFQPDSAASICCIMHSYVWLMIALHFVIASFLGPLLYDVVVIAALPW
jgi:hypothetical protein